MPLSDSHDGFYSLFCISNAAFAKWHMKWQYFCNHDTLTNGPFSSEKNESRHLFWKNNSSKWQHFSDWILFAFATVHGCSHSNAAIHILFVVILLWIFKMFAIIYHWNELFECFQHSCPIMQRMYGQSIGRIHSTWILSYGVRDRNENLRCMKHFHIDQLGLGILWWWFNAEWCMLRIDCPRRFQTDESTTPLFI